jgi:hypothetical protein
LIKSPVILPCPACISVAMFLTTLTQHDVLQQPEVGAPKAAATPPVPSGAALSHGPAAEPSQAVASVSVQEQAHVATASTGANAPVPGQEQAHVAAASTGANAPVPGQEQAHVATASTAAHAPGAAVQGVIRQVCGFCHITVRLCCGPGNLWKP